MNKGDVEIRQNLYPSMMRGAVALRTITIGLGRNGAQEQFFVDFPVPETQEQQQELLDALEIVRQNIAAEAVKAVET